MGEATGVLEVVRRDGVETFSWNGNVDDRNAAREAFNTFNDGSGVLAIVHDAPGKSRQVRSFDEIERIKKERGTVTATISHALVGG